MQNRKIFVDPNDKYICVVNGDNTERNKELFKSAIRMLFGSKLMVIGDSHSEIDSYKSMGGIVEVYAAHTEVPQGENILLLDGRQYHSKG